MLIRLAGATQLSEVTNARGAHLRFKTVSTSSSVQAEAEFLSAHLRIITQAEKEHRRGGGSRETLPGFQTQGTECESQPDGVSPQTPCWLRLRLGPCRPGNRSLLLLLWGLIGSLLEPAPSQFSPVSGRLSAGGPTLLEA